MRLWERIAIRGNREVYYYDTKQSFEAEEFASRLYDLICTEQENGKTAGVVFLCIGTDRSTGDSLGPLIGYKLKEKRLERVEILGTLERPVHAMNLETYQAILKFQYPDHVVVAVDASVGNIEHIGYVTLGKGSLKPGLGVSKELKAVGDIFYHGYCRKLRQLRSLNASEHPAVCRHADGGLHQQKHLSCRKVMGKRFPPLTGFALILCYDSLD